MDVERADVVVVGAGPGGSAAAAHAARAGLDVLLLEKERVPRDKVCGDGLTPRAVKALQDLGLQAEAAGEVAGWQRQDGLRMRGGGVVWELPWPAVDGFPTHSVTATRARFDETLARHAEAQGARLEQEAEALEPVWLDAGEQRIAGVRYRRADGTEAVARGRVVVLADGGSSRLAVQLGLHRDERRPMGVAVRGYWRSPLSRSGMMEGFLDLATADGEFLPGYGWIFPLDDGLVNVGWGLISTSRHFQSTNYRKVLQDWVAGLPAAWQLTPATQVGRPRGAGLPMGHNRHPHVARGALLLGDSGGMVNPFNGEGISYAIEAGGFAADAVADAVRRRDDRALDGYAQRVRAAWGGYYRLGHVFLRAMGDPRVMDLCTRYGMPRRRLMDFVFKTMAHLVDPRGRTATDLVVATLSRAVPAA